METKPVPRYQAMAHRLYFRFLVLISTIFILLNTASAQTGPGNQSFVSFTASPECADSKNGKIRIMIEDDIPPPWSLPFDYRYENLDNGHIGSGVCTGNITEILNLEKGNYKIWVELDVSCSAVGFAQVTEVPNTLDLILNVPNTNMCNKGKIVADLQGGTTVYSYLWSNGSTQPLIDDLAPGEYCVTATDSKGCIAEGCELIKSHAFTVDISDFKNVSECITNYSSSDGEINIEITGPVGENYTYKWSGPNGFAATQKNINALKPGEYKLTVSNTFGCSVILTKKLCCCETDPDNQGSDPNACFTNSGSSAMKLDAIIQHPTSSYASDGSIYPSITGTGAKGSLSYTWSGPSGFTSFKKDIVELSEGNYCLTVTDGCASVSKCFEIYPCKIEFEQRDACAGYEDGKVIVKLYNPNLFNYQISNNGINLPSSLPLKYFEYQIGNLEAKSINNIVVLMGECAQNEFFEIKEGSTMLKLTSNYGVDLVCNYDEYCNENLIKEKSVVHKPFFNYQESQGNTDKGLILIGGGCDVNGYCDLYDKSTKLVTYHYDLKTIKAAQYINLATVAQGSGLFNKWVLQNNIDYIAGKEDLCGKVRYCPGNLETVGFFGSVAGDCGGEIQTNQFPNCYKLDCCWVDGDNYDYCDCDLVPEYLKEYCYSQDNNNTGNGGTTINCKPKKYKVYDLIYNYYYWKSIPGFLGSSLDAFLLDVLASPSKLKKSICAEVTFCSTDFKKLKDDLDYVNCNPVEYVKYWVTDPRYFELSPVYDFHETCYFEYDENGRLITYCNKNGQLFVSVIYEYKNGLNQKTGTSEEIVNYKPLDCNLSDFKRFTYSFDTTRIDPLGIFNKSDGSYYEERATNYGNNRFEKFSNIEFLYDNWRNDYRVIINTDSTNSSYILYFQNQTSNHISGFSSDYLKIESLHVNGSSVFLTGKVNGNLKLNSQIIKDFETTSYFLAEFDTSGMLLKLDKILFKGKLESSLTKEGLTMVGVLDSATNSFTVNNSTIGSVSRVVKFFNNPLDNSLSVEQGISIIGNYKYVKSVNAPKDSITLLMINGNGSIIGADNIPIAFNNNQLIGVIYNRYDNQIKGNFKLNCNKFDLEGITACINPNGDIFVGVTFSDSIKLGAEQYISSKGGKDIFMLKISKNGSVIGVKHYGGVQDETVVELLADSKNLFIGGNLIGPLTNTEIGKIQFKSFYPVFKTGYTSFLPISEFEVPMSFKTKPIDKLKPITEHSDDFELFPNPSTGQLFVKYAGNAKISKMEIHNILGERKQIYTFDQVSDNYFNLDVSNLDSGFFILSLIDLSGKVVDSKTLIKTKL